MPYVHRTQDETRSAIFEIVASSSRPLSRREIAEALGRAKSPHILNMIESLVEQGYFVRTITTRHNGVQGYAYTVSDEFRQQSGQG
jgi:predicted transcriptional regulator